ncbi:MAG: stage III sporulation protein AF [Lachnospiraceae bacterium]|nr:stage III sporulation protein AF [Lachnospiraceae bacterium]
MVEKVIEIVQRIGVFMILGETLIHFCPGKSYEKYIRLIMEMMLITMLLIPFISLIKTDVLRSFYNELETFKTTMLTTEGMQEMNGDADSIMKEAVSEETAVRIQENIAECVEKLGYKVRYVQLSNDRIYVYVIKADDIRTDIYIAPIETVGDDMDTEEKEILRNAIAEKLYVNQEYIEVRGS